jgi:hypothetical protein
MAIHYKSIRTKREWKSTIGLSEEEFHKLCKLYGSVYENYHGHTIEVPETSNLTFKTYEESVFFVSFQLKQGLNFDTLGFIFGTDGSNAHRHFVKIIKLLEITLTINDFMPKRKIKDMAEFTKYLGEEEEFIIDVSEESIERPKDKVQQKAHYSGKKNNIR